MGRIGEMGRMIFWDKKTLKASRDTDKSCNAVGAKNLQGNQRKVPF